MVPETPPEMITETTEAAYYKVPYPTEDTFAEDAGEHSISVLFINAGKADCILLEADGRAYLIDTGEDSSVPQILSALAYREITAIEAVFLTHTDKDHIGGWDAILRRYPVGMLYTALQREAPETYERMAGELPYQVLSPGYSVPIGNEGLYLDVLCPVYLYPEEENNNSLVLRLDCGEETILFTGDMKDKEEADLLDTGYRLDCTVLKVPYHGRRDGSSSEFLAACTPELSIICSDTRTDPDTAHKKVLERLRTYGDVYRTEDADLGWLLTLTETGRTITNVRISQKTEADLSIADISIDAQTVTIQNDGEQVDLGGCFLYSDRGSETYVFPEGTILEAGETITIGCVGSQAELIWEGETSVWHKSKEDRGILYDRWGNVLDTKKAK